MLKVEHISTGYGTKQVLFDVSLEVKQGEIVLVIGSNGSGKSTLLKAIYGLLPLFGENNGNIIFDGESIVGEKPYQLIQKGLVYVPQKNNVFDQLTVRENLEVAATHLQNKIQIKRRISKVFETLPRLVALQSRKPFNLSGGERQQLALGMALVQEPKLIMLDEPGAGLAPATWGKNIEIFKNLNKDGITFLLVEHKVKESFEMADKIVGLKLGKIVIEKKAGVQFNIDEMQAIFV